MALTFQGVDVSAINWGLITSIKVRQQGTGTLTSVGEFSDAQIKMKPLTKEGEPGATDIAYAIEYQLSFNLLQTETNAEIAMLTGTAGTGLFETDVEIEIGFVNGRKITLGTVTAYPLRMVVNYEGGDFEKSEEIVCTAHNIEPITSFPGKVS